MRGVAFTSVTPSSFPTETLDIMNVDFTCARLAYVDLDDDEQTLTDNMIMYYTNSAAGGGRVITSTSRLPARRRFASR